jgi:hypothetical protein
VWESAKKKVDTGSGIGSGSSSGQLQSAVKAPGTENHRIATSRQQPTAVYHGHLQEKFDLEARIVLAALWEETTGVAQLLALWAGKETDAQNIPTQKKNRKCIHAVAAVATTRAPARDTAMAAMVRHNTTVKATTHNLLTSSIQDHHRCTVILHSSHTMPTTVGHSNRTYLSTILNPA